MANPKHTLRRPFTIPDEPIEGLAIAIHREDDEEELPHREEPEPARMTEDSNIPMQRTAAAEATILMHPDTQAMVLENRIGGGEVLAAARVAAVMAAKRTSDLIPLCYPVPLDHVQVTIDPLETAVRTDGRAGFHVSVTANVTGTAGIETDVMTAAAIACLTVYDMCRQADPGMEIVGVRPLRSDGTRSGAAKLV